MKTNTKKLLCIILVFCISLSMVPVTYFAQTPTNHWALTAVETLNGIYGDELFSTDDNAIVKSDMKNFLSTVNWHTDVILDADENLNRAEACEILAEVFKLPISEDSTAIDYFYDKKIINGYTNGDLGADDDVTYAQFAMLTYRVLRTLGVGLGTKTGLKPGTDEYFAYNYLKTRTMKVDLTTTINEDKWNTWISNLNNISFNNKPSDEFACEYPGDTETQLEAAKKIVNEYITYGGIDSIFSDVTIDSPFYDGVMYLFDREIVNGYGDGSGNFGPYDYVDRISLSVLLYRISPNDNPDVTDVVINPPADTKDYLLEFMKKAVANGYMTEPYEGASEWWSENASRKEVITAVMKAVKVNVESVNPTILERFKDKDDFIDDISPYIVYSVMLGIVKGTQDGYLNLNGDVTRGELGLFLYRTLLGVDNTKMQDYRDMVDDVLSTVLN